MKKIILLLILSLLWLVGCTSTGFVGLAKESYAEGIEKDAEITREKVDDLKAEVKELQEDLEKMEDLSEELISLIKDLKEAKKDTEELKKLANIVEERLEELPVQTLEKLVDILNEYIQKEKISTPNLIKP